MAGSNNNLLAAMNPLVSVKLNELLVTWASIPETSEFVTLLSQKCNHSQTKDLSASKHPNVPASNSSFPSITVTPMIPATTGVQAALGSSPAAQDGLGTTHSSHTTPHSTAFLAHFKDPKHNSPPAGNLLDPALYFSTENIGISPPRSPKSPSPRFPSAHTAGTSMLSSLSPKSPTHQHSPMSSKMKPVLVDEIDQYRSVFGSPPTSPTSKIKKVVPTSAASALVLSGGFSLTGSSTATLTASTTTTSNAAVVPTPQATTAASISKTPSVNGCPSPTSSERTILSTFLSGATSSHPLPSTTSASVPSNPVTSHTSLTSISSGATTVTDSSVTSTPSNLSQKIPKFWFSSSNNKAVSNSDAESNSSVTSKELQGISNAFTLNVASTGNASIGTKTGLFGKHKGNKGAGISSAKPVTSQTRTLKPQSTEWKDLIQKTLGFPLWWSNILSQRVMGSVSQKTTTTTNPATTATPEITYKAFSDWWEKEMIPLANIPILQQQQQQQLKRQNSDENSEDESCARMIQKRRFFEFVKNNKSRDFILRSDFYPFIRELLLVHPGLEFLKQTPEFQEKYVETVVLRIFYTCNRNGRGRLTFREYSQTSLHDAILRLDQESDINLVTEFFSYEHFYVLYCKFWELDTDHDFFISKEDLLKYNNYSLTETVVDVIFKGIPRKLSSKFPNRMNYEDFIWFCLSEEDKTTDTSLEYWFRCIDVDGDGVISGYELEYFFREQRKRMENLLAEQIAFEDILCQMIDMIKPKDGKWIRLSDIRACRNSSGVFFNALFNLNKFVAFEQRDPFQVYAETLESPEKTDWDRFARLEYDRMAQEAEQSEELSMNNSSLGQSPTNTTVLQEQSRENGQIINALMLFAYNQQRITTIFSGFSTLPRMMD